MLHLFLSDSQFNSLALVLIAAIGIVPASLGAVWARTAKSNSAQALHEVETNGGMNSALPNLNDHVKYQTEMAEKLLEKVSDVDSRFSEHIDEAERIKEAIDQHIEHSRFMDRALAEVYLQVKKHPEINFDDI